MKSGGREGEMRKGREAVLPKEALEESEAPSRSRISSV